MEKTTVKHLFSCCELGSLTLRNRIVASAVTTNYANPNGSATERIVEFYKRRAAGCPGLVIVEGSFICLQGKGYVNQLGIHHDEMIPGLQRIASAIHKGGTLAFAQIQHCGRRTSSKITGVRCVSASPIPVYEGGEIPEEMDEEMIEESIQEFAAAALRAKRAGFDGVDIHAAHGYLPGAFLSKASNCRTDRWGGFLGK